MELERRDRIVQPRSRANHLREERADKAKPFEIPKREVWEAFKKVRANQERPELMDKRSKRLRLILQAASTNFGIGCPQAATIQRRFVG
jgi:hypothetical protein